MKNCYELEELWMLCCSMYLRTMNVTEVQTINFTPSGTVCASFGPIVSDPMHFIVPCNC